MFICGVLTIKAHSQMVLNEKYQFRFTIYKIYKFFKEHFVHEIYLHLPGINVPKRLSASNNIFQKIC